MKHGPRAPIRTCLPPTCSAAKHPRAQYRPREPPQGPKGTLPAYPGGLLGARRLPRSCPVATATLHGPPPSCTGAGHWHSYDQVATRKILQLPGSFLAFPLDSSQSLPLPSAKPHPAPPPAQYPPLPSDVLKRRDPIPPFTRASGGLCSSCSGGSGGRESSRALSE